MRIKSKTVELGRFQVFQLEIINLSKFILCPSINAFKCSSSNYDNFGGFFSAGVNGKRVNINAEMFVIIT